MEHQQQNCFVAFFNSDDDSLLLDDANTDNPNNTCWKCQGTGVLQIDPIEWLNSSINNDRLHVPSQLLDDYQLEDSPLLNDDRIGHLSVKEFHCHENTHPDTNVQAFKTLCIVSSLCFIFMVMEIIGGHIAGSLAVMTDAAHLFSDIIGFLVSILSIWIGRRPKTQEMTFGFHRVEVMGAFVSVLIVWLLAGIFCFIAIDRMIHHDFNIDANTMIIIATLGVLINIIMGAFLHGSCLHTKDYIHSHENPLNHHHTHSHGDNLNIRAAAAHVIGDLLQSVGVLCAAVIIKFFPSAAIADPICTILFSVIIVLVTFRVAKDSFLILVEASPMDTMHITTDLKNITGVKHVHSLHIWTLSSGKDAITVHLAVDDNCDREIVLNQATSIVRRKLNPIMSSIQIERYDQEQMTICLECQQ